jgi:hypothetical protein
MILHSRDIQLFSLAVLPRELQDSTAHRSKAATGVLTLDFEYVPIFVYCARFDQPRTVDDLQQRGGNSRAFRV